MYCSKRHFPFRFLLLTLVTVLFGCSNNQNIVFGGSGNSSVSNVRLSFFGNKYEALNVMSIEKIMRGYMTEFPSVNISYESVKGTEYFEVLNKRMATGNGDDIIVVDQASTLELGAAGKLADLSELDTLKNYSELALNQMHNEDSKTLYVPTSISAFGLYCNETLLKKHGQKIPTNLAEFEATADYFVSEGIYPLVANNDISLKTVALAVGMFPVYQSDEVSSELNKINDGRSDFGEILRPGFELVQRFIERGYLNMEVTLKTEKTKDDLLAFATGTSPFMLTGAWAALRMQELNPDFKFSVIPYPFLTDGSVLVINMDTRIGVNANSQHVEEAKSFIEYFTAENNLRDFVDSQCSFSPLKTNRLSSNKAIQAISPYLTNGRNVIGSDDNLSFPVWTFTKNCIVEMLEGGSAGKAVQSLNRQLSEWRDSR